MMDMVNDYLDHVEAGRMYLRGEQKKSSSYLAQEKRLPMQSIFARKL